MASMFTSMEVWLMIVLEQEDITILSRQDSDVKEEMVEVEDMVINTFLCRPLMAVQHQA